MYTVGNKSNNKIYIWIEIETQNQIECFYN